MVRLACISTCRLPTGKKTKAQPDGMLKKYEPQTYDSDPEGDIYEFTEEQAKIVMASGCFEPVE